MRVLFSIVFLLFVEISVYFYARSCSVTFDLPEPVLRISYFVLLALYSHLNLVYIDTRNRFASES